MKPKTKHATKMINTATQHMKYATKAQGFVVQLVLAQKKETNNKPYPEDPHG